MSTKDYVPDVQFLPDSIQAEKIKSLEAEVAKLKDLVNAKEIQVRYHMKIHRAVVA